MVLNIQIIKIKNPENYDFNFSLKTVDMKKIEDINEEFNNYREKQKIVHNIFQKLGKNEKYKEQFNIACKERDETCKILESKLNIYFIVFYISNIKYGVYFNDCTEMMKYKKEIVDYYNCDICNIEGNFNSWYESIEWVDKYHFGYLIAKDKSKHLCNKSDFCVIS